MKVNLDAPILDLRTKEPIMDGVRYLHRNGQVVVGDDGSPVVAHPGETLTLGGVAYVSLTMDLPEDRQMAVGEKMRLVKLAALMVEGGEIDISAEDVALLKNRVGSIPQRVVAYQARELLEAADRT